MSRMLSLLSVVTPMLDEEETAEAFYARMCSALEALPFELIIVDDGSRDRTPEILRRIAETDPRVQVVRLSRNFGHQNALSAGLDRARGDAVVTIDADLQDPPEVIPRLVERWAAGADVVLGVRAERAGEARWRLWAIDRFYAMFGRISQVHYSANCGDFRLLDRRAVDILNAMPERNRYLRGMALWIGFEQAEVHYDRDPRHAGETKYPLFKLIRLALDGVSSFSHVPLQMATAVGFAFAALAFLGIPAAIIAHIAGIYVPGIASVILVVCLLSGIQLITLGVAGEYIGRIYDEVKRRPMYVVSEQLNAPGATATVQLDEPLQTVGS
jgi:glycosyltransferase involved in cell wall biosynthesis